MVVGKFEDISLLDESNSNRGNDSPYYLLKAIKLLSHHREFNSATWMSKLSGQLSDIEFDSGSLRTAGRILGNDSLRRTTFHAIDSGAVTLLILREALGLTLGTAARQLSDLQSYGVLSPSVRILRPADAGAREYGASSAHIYDRDGLLIKTLTSTGGNVSHFGQSVAVFGDQIVVGEPFATINGLKNAGKIHLYDHAGNLIKTIQSPRPQRYGEFGFAMATDAERLVVSEPGPWAADENMTSSVYILDESGTFTHSFDRPQLRKGSYGWSVGIHGDVLVVSEPYAASWAGIVHIYNLSVSGPPKSMTSPSEMGRGNFGGCVSVGDDVIAVGEVRGDANGTSMAGTAHLYSINGTLIKNLYPVAPRESGYYGIRVFVSESYVAVNQAGYIYLYDHHGNPSFTVSEENLVAADFGYDVVVDGDRLAAGVPLASVGAKRAAGEVYLYHLKPISQDVEPDTQPYVYVVVVLGVAVTIIVVAAVKYIHRRSPREGSA